MRIDRISFYFFIFFFLIIPKGFSHHGGHMPTEFGEEDKTGISGGNLINSPTAAPLGKNRFLAGFSFNYFRYHAIPAANAHRLHHNGHDVHGKNHEQFYNMAIGYGVLEDFDFYLMEPIVSKNSIEVHDHGTLGAKEKSNGFGDLRFGTKYRFLKQYVEAAVLAGIKFPTGKITEMRKSGDKFEPETQPGTGSWDGDFGIAISRRVLKSFFIASSFQYVLKGEGAQDLKQGDVYRYNLGAGYFFREIGKYPNVSISTEFNQEWARRDHSREMDQVLDSGGTTTLFTPGITTDVTRNLSLYLGFHIPIYQNLGGEHEELKFGFSTGASVTI